MEILHEKLYIRDNKITELQKLCQESGAANTKVSIKSGEEVSQISEKIRSEYIAVIEILQSNLETLKLKYQNEVAGRKNDLQKHKESIKGYKRKIKILEEEKGNF